MAMESGTNSTPTPAQDGQWLDLQKTVRAIAGGGTVIFLGATLTAVLNPLLRVIIARAIGPQGYGLIALGFMVMALSSSLADLGLPSTVARFIALDEDRNGSEMFWTLVLKPALMVLAASGVVSLILYVFADQIARSYFHDFSLSPVLRIFVATIPFAALTQLFLGCLRGLKKMASMALVSNILGDGGRVVLLVVLEVFGLTVIRVSFLYLLSYVLTSVASLVVVVRSIRHSRGGSPHGIRVSLREILTFTTPLFFSQGLTQLLRQFDLLILGYFVDAPLVGIYAAAIVIPRVISTGTNALSVAIMPNLSQLFAEGKMDILRRVFRIVVLWSFYLSFPVLLLLLLIPGQTMYTLYGPEYERGATVLAILAASVVLARIPGALHDEALIAVGKTRIKLMAVAAAVVCALVLGISVVPRFGIIGAAWTSLGANLVFLAVEFAYLHRHFGLQPFGSRNLKFMVSCVAGSLLVILLSRFHMPGLFLILLGLPAIYATGFLGLWLLKGFDEVELTLVTTLASYIRHRLASVSQKGASS